MVEYIRLLRPQQWVKNVFIFAGLIFSRQFFDPASIIASVLGFAVFCLISSAGYIVNDILDLQADRSNPEKARRPLAAGRVSRNNALALCLVLTGVALAVAAVIGRHFALTGVFYLALMVLYSLKAKHVVILDVLFVAAAYVLRAIAGAIAVGVEISSWLIVCTFLFALFIVLAKRRGELARLGDGAVRQRPVLARYTLAGLDQMITIAAAACLVSYCIYTLSPETIVKFRTRNLIFTVPVVIYGLLRYLHIATRDGAGGMPDRLLFTDRPLILSVAIWAGLCLWFIY